MPTAPDMADALSDIQWDHGINGRPASGDAQTLLQHAAAIRSATAARQLSPAAQSAWGVVQGHLVTLAQAFGQPAQQP